MAWELRIRYKCLRPRETASRAAGKSCSGKAPGWGRLDPGRMPCVQAHPLSSNPAVDDARDEGAYWLPGREAEDELLEALELAAPAQVLGEDVGREVVGRCPKEPNELLTGELAYFKRAGREVGWSKRALLVAR